ncbi:hypothetical protein ABZS66_51500 [Dactylosporangium sp. NPDC005572]|uniref:hypothetical protein n=1 Tax=Dactylosporangium sp. NPDC005572 TaxID=3156889 RepID=UPI0033AE5075
MRHKRWWAAGAALAVVAAGAVTAVALTRGDDPVKPATVAVDDPPPRIDAGGTAVGPEGGTAAFTGVEVVVPPGAAAGTVTIASGAALGETRDERFGVPVEVRHDQPLAKPLTVRWDVAGLTPLQRATLVLGRWQDETWKRLAVTTTLDGDRLSAEVAEFSIVTWIANRGDDVSQWWGKAAGTRVDAPKCSGKPLHGWVRQVVDPDEDTPAAAVRVCFEPDRDEIVTARVANNRAFAQRLTMTGADEEWAWTWPGEERHDPSGIVYGVAHTVFDTGTSFLLPPLHETAVGIGRPAQPGQPTITATAKVDLVSVGVDIAAYLFGHFSVGGLESEVANAFVQALFECGGKQWLGKEFAKDLRAVADTVGGCAGQIVDPDSEFGARFEALEQQLIAKHPGTTAKALARTDRIVHQVAKGFAVLNLFDVAFYLSDQLAETMVGPLGLSVRGDGKPQQLGVWKPTCTDTEVDSNRIYRNLALQDTFADKSKELWQFEQWQPAARQAVVPLDACPDAYLLKLAEYLPGDWGDPKAARVVANEIRVLGGAAPLPTECLTAAQAKAQAKRLLVEAGITPSPQYTGINNRKKVTCDGEWALVDSLAVYPYADAVSSDYYSLSGPVLVRFTDGRWVGVSANMSPFDCGADGCEDEGPTNKAECAKAPKAFRARLGC